MLYQVYRQWVEASTREARALLKPESSAALILAVEERRAAEERLKERIGTQILQIPGTTMYLVLDSGSLRLATLASF